MTVSGTVRPPPYGDADQPDPEPFVSWTVRNPAKVLVTVTAAAVAIWANLTLADTVEEPSLQSYPRTALLEIKTADQVCWKASGPKGLDERGCGNGSVTLRRAPDFDREMGMPAFFASVTKDKQTDVHRITVSLSVSGEVVDRASTKLYVVDVTAPD